jgi:hypothetical protein
MIDVKQIPKLIKYFYKTTRRVTIDPKTGMVSCTGDVELTAKTNSLVVKWHQVSGNFDCDINLLTSLEGAPQHVGGTFRCNTNQLDSLKGAPQHVGGDFVCNENNLTTLEGAPQGVGGVFLCEKNRLTSLKGAPHTVGEDFWCRENDLSSLEGLPDRIAGNLFLDYSPTLPLLRLLLIKGVGDFRLNDVKLQKILAKYKGKGWSAMVPCARELIRAGYKGNARL